jgi:hypothetical protein
LFLTTCDSTTRISCLKALQGQKLLGTFGVATIEHIRFSKKMDFKLRSSRSFPLLHGKQWNWTRPRKSISCALHMVDCMESNEIGQDQGRVLVVLCTWSTSTCTSYASGGIIKTISKYVSAHQCHDCMLKGIHWKVKWFQLTSLFFYLNS